MSGGRNILLLMSGSIACAKASGLVSHWVRRGDTVRIACTASALRFIGRATLEGLSGYPVFDDAFEPGRAMDHIGLAAWADLIVLCPATANLINKLAAGIADDPVTTVWMAAWGRDKPAFVVPAMNSHMWDYPATRQAVTRLRQWGVHVLPTAEGSLACGEHGAGRMLECEDILRQIDRVLEFGSATGPRVLVTGGGTRVPIDAVRYIGNRSSGRTSATLADEFARAGCAVTWLGSRSAIHPAEPVRVERYETFAELDQSLKRLLGETAYDLVVHAAAVSDFSPAAVTAESRATPAPEGAKLPSGQGLTLHLEPTPKLLSHLRAYSCNPDVRVVGFKLTANASPDEAAAAVQRQFARSAPDAVVHNDLGRISSRRHEFDLYLAGREPTRFANSRELAQGIRRLLG